MYNMGITNEILTVKTKNKYGHGTIEAFCFHIIKYLEMEETLEIVLTYTLISHAHTYNLHLIQMWKMSLEK